MVITVCATLEYYKLIRRAHREYEKAREVVGDIVLSLKRQLGRESERVELMAYKVEGIASKSEGAINKATNIEKQMHTLETSIKATAEEKVEILTRFEGITAGLRDIAASQEAVTLRITNLEQQSKQLPVVPEASVAAVIPIRRDKVLAPLTETELSTLEILSTEGSKTAPEIKERVKLSREHTARLMKKLYEDGYLERDTTKIPFTYSVKKEMEKLLKKTDTQVT